MEIEAATSEARTRSDFDTTFRDLFPKVARSAALVARDPHLGPDIAQEAFARLHERWDRIDSDEHARHFVFRVAINLGRSHLRRRLAAPFGLHAPETPGADAMAASDAWLTVASALDKLSRSQRSCVVLVDYADMDASSAGRVLGITEDTVRVHLMRGRSALRAALSLPEEEAR